ncbi:MAG: GNAT family N-acetyltransferase [Cryomorphaceae bacterium]|nr:GNAT family N-acetyltransferase [Cryomorphaceae bacterium]
MFCRNFKEFKETTCKNGLDSPFNVDCKGVDIAIYDQLPAGIETEWDKVVQDTSVFLQTKYFHALGVEHANIRYTFATFHQSGKLIGVAAFHITIAETNDLGANLRNRIIRAAVGHLTRRAGLKFQVLVLGNSFATGDHGFRFVDGVDTATCIASLNSAVERIQEREKVRGNRISAVVVKDFYPAHFILSDRFADVGYSEFFVDPNMIMPINQAWGTFEDYLGALTTKYRTKAKSAMKKSESLTLVDLTSEDIDTYQADLFRLYEQVYERADFKLGKLEAQAFFALKLQLKQCFFLKGYLLDGKMVGFQSGFFYNNVLDAHFVGIDYAYNQSHAIYQRMLYEYIREAIRMKTRQVVFGRTAMEIKSTVGAFPVDMKCYIRHRKKAPNALLKLLFGYIKPGDFEQRVAFKQKELETLQIQ